MSDFHVMTERDWLIQLVNETGRANITDTGFDFVQGQGELVYQVPAGRFEVTVRQI